MIVNSPVTRQLPDKMIKMNMHRFTYTRSSNWERSTPLSFPWLESVSSSLQPSQDFTHLSLSLSFSIIGPRSARCSDGSLSQRSWIIDLHQSLFSSCLCVSVCTWLLSITSSISLQCSIEWIREELLPNSTKNISRTKK